MDLSKLDGQIWLDGKLVPWQEAKVHVLTHTFHYGWVSLKVCALIRPKTTAAVSSALKSTPIDYSARQKFCKWICHGIKIR